MQSEHEGGYQSGEPKPLICASLQRRHPTNEQRCGADNKQDADPAELRPNPKPIAFWMKRTGVGARGVTKEREDRLKIPETNAGPGRRANHLPAIVKNSPAKIGSKISTSESLQVKAGERLTTGKQERGEQKQNKRSCERGPDREAAR